jgi:hypothetical protein
MVAARANWKGFIKFGEVACAVALYTAASSSERIAFNTLNRATGNRIRREFVDSETGDPVERDDQVKGYEIENGDYVVLEPEEVAAAIPDSDKTLKIEAFVPCKDGRRRLQAAEGRHARGQGCSTRAHGTVPSVAHGADPSPWQWPDWDYAEFRL